jgi:hypothetical protein
MFAGRTAERHEGGSGRGVRRPKSEGLIPRHVGGVSDCVFAIMYRRPLGTFSRITRSEKINATDPYKLSIRPTIVPARRHPTPASAGTLSNACSVASLETDRPEHLHVRRSDVECCEPAAALASVRPQTVMRTLDRDTSGTASCVRRRERDKARGSPDIGTTFDGHRTWWVSQSRGRIGAKAVRHHHASESVCLDAQG